MKLKQSFNLWVQYHMLDIPAGKSLAEFCIWAILPFQLHLFYVDDFDRGISRLAFWIAYAIIWPFPILLAGIDWLHTLRFVLRCVLWVHYIYALIFELLPTLWFYSHNRDMLL